MAAKQHEQALKGNLTEAYKCHKLKTLTCRQFCFARVPQIGMNSKHHTATESALVFSHWKAQDLMCSSDLLTENEGKANSCWCKDTIS